MSEHLDSTEGLKPILLGTIYLVTFYPKSLRILGDYIRKFRMDKGLLIRELANQLGVSENTVLNWEVWRRIPDKMNLKTLYNLLEML